MKLSKLSNAEKDTLSYIATGGGLAKCGLSLAQVDEAAKQLAERGLIEPSDSPEAVKGYTLTDAGHGLRNLLRARGDAF